VNGLDHRVLEWPAGGAGTLRKGAPTAIIVHGFQDAAGTWDDVAIVLARAGLRVLAPDMRGFGDGARVAPGGYYYFPDYVADVAGIVRAHIDGISAASPRDGQHQEPARLFVIGHSMGATVSTYFTGAFPERVERLALIDGCGPPDNPPDVAPARMRRWIETAFESPPEPKKPMTWEDALARLCKYNPQIDRAVLARKLVHLARETEGGLVWKNDPLHGTTSPIPFFGASYIAFARQITCPVLYVSGGPQGFHVPDEDERLAAFPKLEKRTIDGGHALHWSRPVELAEMLVGFWQG
jgi:pimeloyl-ACP methyl ester carboxylesterase